MFNVYKFEDTVKQEEKLENIKSTRIHEKKISKKVFLYLIELRDEMSKKYKDRIADFIK